MELLKIYKLFVACVCACCLFSCSNDEENLTAEQKMLDGLIFTGKPFLTLVPKDTIDDGGQFIVDFEELGVLDALGKDNYRLDSVLCNSQQEKVRDSSTVFYLEFKGTNCLLSGERSLDIVHTKTTWTSYTYIFKPGEYTMANSFADKIIVYDNKMSFVKLYDGIPVERSSINLKDFGYNYTAHYKTQKENTKEIKPLDNKEYTYSVSGNQIFFKSNEERLVGKIDWEKMEIDIDMVYPEEKGIGSFEL